MNEVSKNDKGSFEYSETQILLTLWETILLHYVISVLITEKVLEEHYRMLRITEKSPKFVLQAYP